MRTIARIAVVAAVLSLGGSALMAQTAGPYQFYALTPCRVVDTRNAASTNGGPALNTTTRNFAVRGNCGVPGTAKAVSVNVTVVTPSASSWLTLWPSDQAQPFVSTINYDPSASALANGALIGLAANGNPTDLSVRNAVGAVHVIIDVTGYYQ